MAATITGLAVGTDTTAGTTCVSSASVTATATDNDWLVVVVAASNDFGAGLTPIASVSDSVGNTYTRRLRTHYTPGGVAGDGAALSIYTSQVTTPITNGTVTANFDASTSQSAIQVYRMRPGAGETISFISESASPGGNGTTHSAPNETVTSGDTYWGAAALETDELATGDSDTTNGSWSTAVNSVADGGGDNDSITLCVQYKTVTGTGLQQWACTSASARDSARGNVILRSAAGGNKEVDADAGSYAVTGTAASLEHGWVVAAAAGSYAVTGTDATLNKGQTLTAAAGSYAVTGVNASLEHGWEVVAGVGSYAVTGSAVTLSINTDRTIAAAAGSYGVTGSVALLDLFRIAEVHRSMPLKTFAPRVRTWVEITPAVQAAAYGANDVVFVATEVPNFTWRNGEPMMLETAYILDEADQAAAAWTLYFGRTTFTLGTINEAVSISDADARLLCGVVQIANTETQDLINSRAAFKHNIGLVVTPGAGTRSCFVAATTGGTPTFAATTDIKLRLGFVS